MDTFRHARRNPDVEKWKASEQKNCFDAKSILQNASKESNTASFSLIILRVTFIHVFEENGKKIGFVYSWVQNYFL